MMPMTPMGVDMRAMSRPFGRCPARQLPADGIGQGGDVFEPVRHGFDAFVVEKKTIAQSRREIVGGF